MQLLSVLNNILKITFNPQASQIKLGDMLEFVIPSNDGIIAQAFKIELEEDEYVAHLRILFTVKNGDWIKWIGNIPPKSSNIKKVPQDDILELFDQYNKNNIQLGYSSQCDCNFKIALKNLGSTFVLFDNNQNKLDILNSIKDEFIKADTPFIIFDFKNEYESDKIHKISAIKDFKLPLNVESLTSIYEKSFQYSSPEMRVLFEDVIAQIKNFFDKSDEIFIPFNIFKSVIDNEKPSIELSLLKNLLNKYEEQGVFANTKADFLRLRAIFKKNNAYIVDMSQIPQEWHKEYVQFVVSSLNKFFVILEDDGLFKNNKDIDDILVSKKNVKFIMAVNYSSEQFSGFIQKAKNLILYASNKKINYFPNLIDYINTLGYDDFIYQGEQTNYVPILLQPKQAKARKVVKPMTSIREVIKTPEEKIVKPANKEDIDDIISEIEVLHSEEENIPIIQDAQNFEEVTVENVDILEELEELQEYTQEDIEELEEIEELPVEEFEIVELQDYIDSDIDELFSEELMNDVDSLYGGSPAKTTTNPEPPKNREIQRALQQQKQQEQAQKKANTIDAQTQNPAPVEFEELQELDELELEVLDELEELETAQEPQEFEELEELEELGELPQENVEPQKPKQEQAPKKTVPPAPQIKEVYAPQEEIPQYPVEENPEPKNQDKDLKNGDMIEHEKFGKGIIKKVISHGKKKLYKIQFETSGVKLLDLSTSEIQKT